MPRRGRDDARPVRPARHPGQQCRHVDPQAARGLHRCRVAGGARHQPDRRFRLRAGGPPGDEGRGGGKIINIGSMFSIFGAAYAVAYAASKGGLVQMTKSLAAAWAARQHPGQRRAARLDRHRADPRRAPRRSTGCTSGCWRAPRPGAGACPKISPASPSFSPPPPPTSSPAPRSRSMAASPPPADPRGAYTGPVTGAAASARGRSRRTGEHGNAALPGDRHDRCWR